MFVAASLHHGVAVETARIPIAWVLIATTTSIPTTPALDANNPTTRSRAAHEQALDHEHALAHGAARASSGSLRSIKRRSAAGGVLHVLGLGALLCRKRVAQDRRIAHALG